MNGLEKAIQKAGTASNLAAKLGIKPMSVSRWKHDTKASFQPIVFYQFSTQPALLRTNCALICIQTPRMDYQSRKRGRNRAFNFISTKYRVYTRGDDKSQSPQSTRYA
jgi:hypothetical protein